MKMRVESSHTAEMLAVCNSLFVALREGLVQDGDHVLMQTDCKAAINAFENNRPTKMPQEGEALRFFRDLRKERTLSVSFRHVKGHTDRKETRYVTNNLCDQRAKDGMRIARRALQKETQR